ncbi:MAG: ATP synthase F1 subunit epsilon, partial [Magnetococcales bacterium]|nr:ATP synthase F1 subunit epsilon [Magnetococcales bacterium]
WPATFQLDVVTPERLVISGKASYVSAPGKDGRFGVLLGHTPFVSLLTAGELTITMQGEGAEQHVALSSGYVEVTNERVTVLVQRALEKSQINPEDAAREEKEATTRLAGLPQGGLEAVTWSKRRDFAKVCLQIAHLPN